MLAAWLLFAGVNIWLMWKFPGRETIPFHFVWISIALVFGIQNWPLRTMMSALAAITAVTGVVLIHHARAHFIGIEEVAEVPLMAAVFLVMVWHVRRRQLAVAQLERIAVIERQRAEAHQVFVRMSSHELRTPITVARGYVELIRSAHHDPQLIEDTVIVLDELDKLDRMTARLNTLMRLDADQDIESLDMDLLIHRAVRRWTPVADRQWQADSTAGVIDGNLERLTVVLDSLIENAVKFTGPGDLIAVLAHREGGQLHVEVRDTGEGIPAEDLPGLFEPFRTGRNVGAKAGTGLGLAIVKAAVDARGGTVDVHSRSGEGTTFTIRTPIAVPWPAPGSTRADAAAAIR